MAKDKDGKKIAAGALGIAGLGAVVYALSRKPPALAAADVTLSDLTISPEEVNPGQAVTIRVTASNIGGQSGTAQITLGGDFMATKSVSLNPGESRVVSFIVTPTEPGVYSVSIDGLTGSFIATEVPVADIRLSNLQISPLQPFVGEVVAISLVAANHGQAVGSKTVTMTVT